ncbi:hypothetical protein F7725_016545 [Dissostichus mawsoni]|uniref:FERM domain-containing protein n=1 Tax=Dissostichus mawsoni TaxID=36200 RepID=A0A7J5Z1X4_DISMA|nr:hypothetical protein F7725_016545 [Dissostichus mawsoni]
MLASSGAQAAPNSSVPSCMCEAEEEEEEEECGWMGLTHCVNLVASGSQLVWSMAHQTLRSWYNSGLMPCRRFLDAWFTIGKCYQMTEGRQCQVHLLDDRKLELLVQPKLLSRELLDLVASHFTLKEKEYFGLSYIDETGQNNWLQLDRKVLDHDFSKTSGPLELKFLVRFYIEKITYLKDNATVELFFLNAKSLVFNGTIEVESENVFKLAAFALQEAKGEYISAEAARSHLKQFPVLPTRVLQEHPSLNYCEDKVIEHYKKLKGLTRGQAIVQYLALVESLPTYGVHYYQVKDKQGLPWWLGVGYKGIGQYDLQDKLKPRKLYQWKQLENLYFREKKFAVEVNDPHRRTVTKRTFGQTGLVIHTWYASHSLIKTIWVMAISQHQFYLDRKQSKSQMTTTRSSGDIAMDLTEICAPRIIKLSSIENQLIMASNGSLISAGSADSEVTDEQKKDKELTGKLPKEYPLATGEKAPPVRRRVGTEFKLDDLFPYDEDPHLRNLESRFALQQKIVEAAIKLSNEGELGKTVKKKRRSNCLDAMRKLEEIEKEINAYRVRKGRKPTQRASLIIADLSSLSDSLTLDDDDELSSQRQRSRSVQYSPRPHHADTLDIHYNNDRRLSDQQPDSRLNYGQVQESVHYGHRDALSSHSSLFKPLPDSRVMPAACPPPLLTRNAYSSSQLSGSLESQSQLTEAEPPVPTFSFTPARRSNSTEVLDDGSSYTSQSSRPRQPHEQAQSSRPHRKDMYANTGSMPNLAQPDNRHANQPRARPTTTAYYVTGYPSYPEPEPYANGVYMYDNEMEGHYTVNPSYHPTQPTYHSHEVHGHYGHDEMDGMSQNPYATLRPPRNRQVPRGNEQPVKNFQKAIVAEHLRGWYQRNAQHQQPAYGNYDYDRGSQHSLGYQTMPSAQSHNHRNIAYSSVSSASLSGNWHGHMSVGSAMSEYDMPAHAPQSYSYSTAPYSHSAHSRSYIDVNQMDPHVSDQMHTNPEPDDKIHWHEDSKPGTIV